MTIIIDAPRFDILVTESNDYQGTPRYIVCYGLQVERFDTLQEALREFRNCLSHAAACQGEFEEAA